MRLLHVLASLDPRAGGISQAVRSLVPELEKLEVRNEAVTCESPHAEWTRDGILPVHALGPGKLGFAYSPKLAPWLDSNLSRFDSVIIHGLWLWPSIATALAVRRIRKAGQPRVFVMPHGMLDPYFQRDPSRRIKAVRNWVYWKLAEHRVIDTADGLLFTCEEERRLATEPFRPYRPRSTAVVGLGISAPPPFAHSMQEAFRAKCPSLGESPYLLFLSRIHPKKGVDLLINAYARLASGGAEMSATRHRKSEEVDSARALPALVIAGPGWETDYGREMKARIEETNLQFGAGSSARIHPVDMLAGDAKWGAFHGCRAFILPSHQENFGIAVVEALACNKPVLISDKVNIWREIVEAGAGTVASDTEEGTLELLRAFQRSFEGDFPSDAPRVCFENHFEIAAAARTLAGVLRGWCRSAEC